MKEVLYSFDKGSQMFMSKIVAKYRMGELIETRVQVRGNFIKMRLRRNG